MSKGQPRILTMASKPRSFSLKFYAEQLPLGWEATCAAIQAIDKCQLQVQGICHDSDLLGDDIWEPSIEKPHYHIIGRGVNGYSIRVSQLLDMLHIVYRPELDEDLWRNHGVETVGDYTRMSVYLTHETDDAIADAKTIYPMDRVVSNLTPEEIQEVRAGYIRVGQNGGYKKTYTEMAELDVVSRRLGYELGDFTPWYNGLDFGTRSHAKMRTIRESYYAGVQERVEQDATLIRLCVYIQGAGNIGKTYATHAALAGKKILTIDGGGTGKFDRLLPSTEAIVIDDQICPNLLNMTDNRMCQVYKRQNNNPYWCGRYFLVTSNLAFRDWVESCGLKTTDSKGDDTSNYKALITRFFICEVGEIAGVNRLLCTSQSTRGTVEEQNERNAEFIKFKERFNTTIAQYHPSRDISVINVTDWLPCEDVTPFDILDDTPLAPADNAKIISTDDCLTRYEREKSKLYKQALSWVKEQYGALGLSTNIPQFKESVLRKCAQLDVKAQLDLDKQAGKAS